MESDVTGLKPQTTSLFALRQTPSRAPARPSDRIRKVKVMTGRENAVLSKPRGDTLCVSEGFSRLGSSLLLLLLEEKVERI